MERQENTKSEGIEDEIMTMMKDIQANEHPEEAPVAV
jgi:hypothetical protein